MEAEALLQSPEIGELAAALAVAQGEFEPAAKDREATIKPTDSSREPYTYKYATLASCLEAIRQPLARNGLAILQLTELEGGEILLVTKLLHKSGQWIASRFPLPIVQATWARPQNVGIVIAFYRRYTLCALLQIATEDTDGHEVMPPPPTNRREDERRPRRDDRRDRRPEQPAATKQAKADAPFDGRPQNYVEWLEGYVERVNRHWLDSLTGNARAPAEIVKTFQLNWHLCKALGHEKDLDPKDQGHNFRVGMQCWTIDAEAMVAEAKVYCRQKFDAAMAKLKPPAREPGSDDGDHNMPTKDEEELVDKLLVKKPAGNA